MKSFYCRQPYADEQVRATIEGQKTLMVLPVKVQPDTDRHIISEIVCSTDRKENGKCRWVTTNEGKTRILDSSECFSRPFNIGERYWLKEAFGSKIRGVGGTPHQSMCYRADKPKEVRCYDCNGMESPVRWRPSVHMPQHASRCTIEIKRVYVKRIDDVTEYESMRFLGIPNKTAWERREHNECRIPNWNAGFRDFLRGCYGDDFLPKNHWCWFVEFEVVK